MTEVDGVSQMKDNSTGGKSAGGKKIKKEGHGMAAGGFGIIPEV